MDLEIGISLAMDFNDLRHCSQYVQLTIQPYMRRNKEILETSKAILEARQDWKWSFWSRRHRRIANSQEQS